ncbi:helix-turn-helix transcriptional regulator [Streptomyces antimycoticus]
MHADLAHPWTVDELARKAGMSRSAFAASFKDLLVRSPP